MPLREHADSGVPLVIEDPDDPASQAIRRVARGLIAMTPAAPFELPVLPLVASSPEGEVGGAAPGPAPDTIPPASPAPADSPKPVGMSLPMA